MTILVLICTKSICSNKVITKLELPRYINSLYHGSLYHDMNVCHDIDKSDEITVIMYTFITAMSWEANDNIIVCYDASIKCKMSKNLLGKVK